MRVFDLDRYVEKGLAEAAEYDSLRMEDLLNVPDDPTLRFIRVRCLKKDLAGKFTYGS